MSMTEQEPGQPLEGISQALADSWAIEGVWQGVGRVWAVYTAHLQRGRTDSSWSIQTPEPEVQASDEACWATQQQITEVRPGRGLWPNTCFATSPSCIWRCLVHIHAVNNSASEQRNSSWLSHTLLFQNTYVHTCTQTQHTHVHTGMHMDHVKEPWFWSYNL